MSVHKTDYKLSCDKMAFYCEPLSSTSCSYSQFSLLNYCSPINVLHIYHTTSYHTTSFEITDLCLNRICKCTALAMHILKYIIAAFPHDEQMNIYKNCRWHTTIGKPRAAWFPVSTDVRCNSPDWVWNCVCENDAVETFPWFKRSCTCLLKLELHLKLVHNYITVQ